MTKTELIIDGVTISDESECYVIAEIGHNHQGDLEQAKKLFLKAKECGASAVKLQKRDNRALYTREMYDSLYDNPHSFGRTYGEHRDFLELDRDAHLELKAYAAELGITFFSTPFDFNSVEFLADLDMPAYKIASGDLTNIPLIREVASLGKPVIISTGGGSMEDVRRAYETASAINSELCIMQCISGYPAHPEELNLKVIEAYRREFPDIVIGYSGHDNGIAMPLVAYMLGARVVEKHFTLDRTMKGTDHAFSLNPGGLQHMVRDLRRARVSLGDGEKRVLETEAAPIHKMGKKLVAARDLEPGHVLTADDVAIKSPGDGLRPYELDGLLGRTLAVPVAMEGNLSFDQFE